MTRDRLYELFQRVELRHPAIDTTVVLREHPVDGLQVLPASLVQLRVGDRDDSREVRVVHPNETAFRMLRPGDLRSVPTPRRFVENWFRHLERAWTHELAECFHVDGRRVFDPHPETRPEWPEDLR